MNPLMYAADALQPFLRNWLSEGAVPGALQTRPATTQAHAPRRPCRVSSRCLAGPLGKGCCVLTEAPVSASGS